MPVSPSRLLRLFPWLEQVRQPGALQADLLAGLLGAVLVLPQGIAFATLAGLPPQYGLYTAIVPCIVAALFGSSRHVMSGPTNASSLALFAMLSPLALAGSQHYIQLALTLTLMVGALQLLLGALRMGRLASFVSPAALHGFTTGAALMIAIYACRDWLKIDTTGARGALQTLYSLLRQLPDLHIGALLAGTCTLLLTLLVRRWHPRWPGMLLGLAGGTLLAWALNSIFATGTLGGIPTVGTIQTPIPVFSLPGATWRELPELVGLALALTIITLAQSISIAQAVAARSGQFIQADREFVGQGLSNIVGSFFSCYVSCGSLNRSMPNLMGGARTPLAAVCSALLLVLLVAVSAPLLAHIAYAAIAGLLLLVAWNLLDLPHWRQLARQHRGDFVVALITAAATVILRMEVAILLGTLLSLAGYLYRTSRPAMRTMVFADWSPDRQMVPASDATHGALPECPQLKLLRMEGSIYFAAVPHVAGRLEYLRTLPDAQPHLLIMAKSMNFIDASGLELWERELTQRRAMGGDLYFHRPRPQVIELWQRTGFLERLGEDHVFPDKGSAIRAIYDRMDPQICAGCRARCFFECRDSETQGQSAGARS
ncbi:SulP family inorganic anion transporter [Alcaligenaceae bacterium SJ-26]|nr:SulP family inorganic anion transporter [Alcaligenaceae bacterium SJ-26]